MNYLKNKVNKIKFSLKRSKSYPGCEPDKKAYVHELDDIMEVICCTASYCSTCEDMIFQALKKCKKCRKRKICYFCYNKDKPLCKECSDKLMKIEDYVDQLL